MVLTPDGFDFAPHPMLVETDREKYAIQRIVNFYERQPTDYADYFQAAWRFKHRAALGKPRATLAGDRGGGEGECEVSAAWSGRSSRNRRTRETGGWPGREAAGDVARAACAGRQAAGRGLRAKCVEMRDFVVEIRNHTAMQFAAPVVKGLPAGSQPLLNWKLRAVRRAPPRVRSDKRCATIRDPPPEVPEIPKYPGLHQEAASALGRARRRRRAPAIPIWWFRPASEPLSRRRSRASLRSFPDAFYVQERGRFFPDDSQDKGRLLSAGYHNVMGYLRDDTPLMELILDEKGQKELDRLWDEFDFIADYTARTWVQYYFNQSGEVQGKGAESGTLRPSDKEVSTPAIIFGLRDAYLAKAAAERQSDRATQAIRVSLPVGERHPARGGAHAGRSRAAASGCAAASSRRAPTAGRCRRRNATICWPTTTRCARRTG